MSEEGATAVPRAGSRTDSINSLDRAHARTVHLEILPPPPQPLNSSSNLVSLQPLHSKTHGSFSAVTLVIMTDNHRKQNARQRSAEAPLLIITAIVLNDYNLNSCPCSLK